MEVVIPAEVHEAIVRHALFVLPDEACGLLAGRVPGRVRMVYPLDNVQASPVAFTIEPEGHFGALRHAERSGWELIGAFHSHPTTEPVPSPTDIRLAYEPDWIHVIVGVADRHHPELRAFRIADAGYRELSIRRP